MWQGAFILAMHLLLRADRMKNNPVAFGESRKQLGTVEK